MIDPDEARWFGLGVFSGAGQLLALYGMPGMKRLYLIVISLFLLGVGAQAQEPIPTLDLTKPLWCEDQLPKKLTGSGSATWVSHRPPPPRVPLDLRLIGIEPRPLREGGKVTYEVELENVGAAPLLIPWGTICDVMASDDTNEVAVGVSLIADEYPESPTFVSNSKYGYGLMDDPRTTRSLAPGGKARIRLSGTIYYSDYPDQLKNRLNYQTQAIIDVRAMLHLTGKPYKKYGYGNYVNRKSSNVAAVEVTR